MQRIEVLERVQSIVRIQFEDASIIVNDSTVVDDIPDWDSVAHIQIIVALENYYGILFDADQYIEFENVGELVDCTFNLVRKKAMTS